MGSSTVRKRVNSISGGGSASPEWGDITGTLTDQTDLSTALGLKANIASPTLTGVPAAPTASNGTNTTQIATTAFVLNNESSDWKIVGNSGTTAGSNFIGTTDAIDFVFKTNNIERFRILSSGDSVVNSLNIGKGAGAVSTNTCFGYQSLEDNTTGSNITALGNQSLALNVSGYENTAIGSQSMFSNTTGQFNTAVGFVSLYSNTSGNINSAFGYNSLYSNTTGSSNSAYGDRTLYSNTTGTRNTAIGAESMLLNNGSYNTAIGSYSLYQSTSANYNSSIGYQSLFSISSGSNNVAIGVTSGFDITTGSYNSILGYNTGTGITTGSNNTIVGARVTGLSSSLSSNIILADGAGTIRLQIDNAGNYSFTGGTTTSEVVVSDETWTVTINGVTKKILLKS